MPVGVRSKRQFGLTAAEKHTMEQQALSLPGPRISRITLGRLHNLGNYEHVRYEVTVELPPGTSPASVARELEDTLNALEPKRPVSDWDLRQAVKTLALPEPVLEPKDDDDPFETPQQVLQRKKADRERARLHIKRHEAWLKSRDAALRRFDALGGSAQWTDAKDRWDDQ